MTELAAESADADRRQARRGGVGQDVRQHQPGDRRGRGRGRRRRRRRHGPGHRRGTAGRSTRPTGRRTAAFRKRCLQQLKRRARQGRRTTLRPQIVTEVGAPIMLTYAVQQDSCIDDMQWDIDLIDRYEWEYEPPGPRVHGHAAATGGRARARSASSVRSRRGTSRSCSTCRSSRRRSRRATPWCSSPRPTRRGAPRSSARSSPSRPTSRPASSTSSTSGDKADGRRDAHRPTRASTWSPSPARPAIGKRIMARTAPRRVKKVFLELGGKSANIILDDADFDGTAVPAGSMVCIHGGQGCAITTRMLLPESRYDEGVDMLKAAFESVPYGDPTDPGNLRARSSTRRQRERVLGYIEKGKADGAKLLVGGGRPPHLDKGYFVEPTLFVDVDPDADDRPGGGVRPGARACSRTTDDDDAVRIANDSMLRAVGRGQQRAASSGRSAVARADPHRHGVGQRRAVVRPRLAVRRLQAERRRTRARRRRLRGVPRDQDARPPGRRVGGAP